MIKAQEDSSARRSTRKTRASRIVAWGSITMLSILIVVVVANQAAILRWYKFVQIFESMGRNEQGYSEYRDRRSGILFVSLPGGRFLVGSDAGEPGAWSNEHPKREIFLSAFMIAKYEISQELWASVMDEHPANFLGASLPVETVSWHDCVTFCERTGFALPTEFQWEIACRAGTSTPFAFGESIDSEQVNFNGRRPYGSAPKSAFRKSTVTVKTSRPNALGLHHMHGNVAEWCRDVFDEDYYKNFDATEPDPVSSTGSGHKVVRGGCWYSQAKHCRSASRSFEDPATRSRNLGFRPVWERGK